MNAETFCEQFATFAEAPNGVAKLRELILQLAVQGKLVPQDPNDEPAINDLKEIEREKQAMIEARSLRPNRISEIEQTRVLQYQIPDSWRWFRLGDVAFFQEGPGIRNWQFRREGVKLLNVQNIVDGQLVLENSDRFVSIEEFEATYTHFRVEQGDILFASSGGSWGKTAWFEEPGYPVMLNTSMIRLKFYSKRCSDDYLLLFLRGQFFRKQMEIQLVGMQPNFGSTHLGRLYIPLPPLAEQRRIVGKVDQLLGLCDELAARQAARREARSALVGATLDRLVSARSAAEFPAHAHRLRDHFDRLFDTPTTLPQLRQAILQLAVQGQLVPQDPNDEPASVSHGNADANDIENVPFTVPTGWSWRLVSDVFDVSGGITKNPKRAPVKNHFPYLRVANVQRGRLKLDEMERFELSDGELERWQLEPGDVLVVEGNGSEDEIGRCALWNGEIANCVHQNHIIRCRPLSRDLQNFVLLFLNSPAGIAEMKERAITTSGLYSLSVGKIRSLAIPIPPLSEQKRIVSKVTELLSLCDALEAKLTKAESASTQLLSAAVHHILSHSA